jgi:multiple sugar transport system substrate-binding protein
MWRFLLSLLLPLVAFAVAQTADPTSTAEPAELQSLSVWTWQSAGADLAEDFGVANPQVQVSVRRFNSGAELYGALLTALRDSSADIPDVIRLEYAFVPLLRHQNALLELSAFLPEDFERGFPAWALKQVSLESDVYAVPVDTSPVALVYRADLLSRYGVALPTTWAQVVTASQKIFSASKGKTRFFNFDTTSSLWFLALAQANGARVWASSAEVYTQNLMHPNAVKLAGTLEDLLRRGMVTKFPSGSLELHKALRDGALVSSAMPLSGAVSLSRVLRVPGAAKYRVAALPGGGSADWGGSGCAVSAQTRQAQLASNYCLWFSTDAAAQRKAWSRDSLLAVASNAHSSLAPGSNTALNAFYGSQDIGVSFSKLSQKVQSQVWVPWLPMTDAVYRRLGVSLNRGDLELREALGRWQATVLVEARKAGFKVK